MSDYDQLAYKLRNPLAAYLHDRATSHDLGRGTAFPTTGYDGNAVVAGDRFYRTDLNFPCVYDGTRWLTQFELPFILATELVLSANTDTPLVLVPNAFNPYVDRVTVITNAAAPNSATNFWTVTIQGINAAKSASTTIYSFNTSADTAGTNVLRENVTTPVPANNTWLRLNATKTLTPGNLAVSVLVSARMIVT